MHSGIGLEIHPLDNHELPINPIMMSTQTGIFLIEKSLSNEPFIRLRLKTLLLVGSNWASP